MTIRKPVSIIVAVLLLNIVYGCGKKSTPLFTNKSSFITAREILPTWNHSGNAIAWLKVKKDRSYAPVMSGPSQVVTTPPDQHWFAPADIPMQTSRSFYDQRDNLAFSPHDDQLLFPVTEEFKGSDGKISQGQGIWSLDPRTKKLTPFAIHPKDLPGPFPLFRSPQWSADGKYVSFLGQGRDGQTAVYIKSVAQKQTEMHNPRYDTNGDAAPLDWGQDGRLLIRQGVHRALTATPVEFLKYIQPGNVRSGTIWRSDKLPLRSSESGTPPRIIEARWNPDQSLIAASMALEPTRPETLFVVIFDSLGSRPPEILIQPNCGLYGIHWKSNSQFVCCQHQVINGKPILQSRQFDLKDKVSTLLQKIDSDDFDWSPLNGEVEAAPQPGRPVTGFQHSEREVNNHGK